MEITNIIKKRISEYYIDKHGKQPTGKQMDAAVQRVLLSIVDNTVNVRNWTQFVPPVKENTNDRSDKRNDVRIVYLDEDAFKNSFQEYYQKDFCMEKEAENNSLNKELEIDFVNVFHAVHTNQPDNYGVYYREKSRVWWNRTYDRITEVCDDMAEELEKLFQEYIIKEECMLVDRMTFGDDIVSTVIASDELIKRENVNSAPKNHEQEGKNKMSLLPLDLLSELLCPAYEEGLLKYERESWRKGFKASVMMDAALRHLSKFYYEREEFDEETMDKYHIQKRHLGACLFCIIAMYNSINIDSKSFDDRPNKGNNK